MRYFILNEINNSTKLDLCSFCPLFHICFYKIYLGKLTGYPRVMVGIRNSPSTSPTIDLLLSPKLWSLPCSLLSKIPSGKLYRFFSSSVSRLCLSKSLLKKYLKKVDMIGMWVEYICLTFHLLIWYVQYINCDTMTTGLDL